MQSELLNNQHKPFLKWHFDEENNWLYLNWIGYCSTENLRKGVEVAIKVLEETNCPYILNGNRELLGPWDSSSEWLIENLVHKATASGLKYFAHVLSPGISGALAAQDLQNRVDSAFKMQLFGDMEKAKAWLKNMQKQNGDSE